MMYPYSSQLSSDAEMMSGELEPVLASKQATKRALPEHSTIVWQIIAVLVVIIALLFIEHLGRDYATLTMEVGGQQRVFQGEVVNGMTLLDALNASVIAGNINLKFAIKDGQTEIMALDGHTGPLAQNQVQFLLNNKSVQSTVINQTPIQPNDSITVRLPAVQ